MVRVRSGRDSVSLDRYARFLVRRALPGVAALCVATGQAVAHSGHAEGHGGGGSILFPTVMLLVSLLVIGGGAYLDHTDGVDGRLARLAVLFGIAGLLVGVLAAV